MVISNTREGNQLTLALSGRLDTVTAPQLEAELTAHLDGMEVLVFDMENLEYLSSAGLRVILGAQKRMNKQGKMTLIHVPAAVLEIFDITGFTDILTIE